jgi:hypothetical protein
MDWLTRGMTALLRRSAGLLPADRRAWSEALRAEAEAGDVPAGWRRLGWLAGGIWLVATQARTGRRIGYPLAFAAAAAGTAWSAWHGPRADAAVLVNRVDVIAIVVLLAGLPWVTRRILGPAGDTRAARIARAGGYASIFALVLVKDAVERFAVAPPSALARLSFLLWAGEVLFLIVAAAYAGVILAVTARRPAVVPATLAFGIAAGVVIGVFADALGPLGAPLRITGLWPAHLYDAALTLGMLLALSAPIAAGWVAARRSSGQDGPRMPAGDPARHGDPARQGALAGLCAGAAAALVVSVLGTATIMALPHEPGLLHWTTAHISQWALTFIGLGTQHDYAVNNSLYAAGYLVVLTFAPLVGCGLGAWGGLLAADRSRSVTASAVS